MPTKLTTVVYEGGQHMQPYLQGEWCYNQAVYDAQLSPKMYDMYMKNFRKMIEPEVNCQLFMAFAYMGARQNKYGSWGHLENMAQIGNLGGYMTIAPKYQALLDANTPKELGIITTVTNQKATSNLLILYPNPAQDQLQLDLGVVANNASVSVIDLQGRSMMNISLTNVQKHCLDISGLSNGVYLIKVINGKKVTNAKFVKN